MKTHFYYRGFTTDIHYSDDDKCFFGIVNDIDDLVTFESPTENNIEKEFQKAVDDYIEFKLKIFNTKHGGKMI